MRDNTGKLAELITQEHGKTLPDAEGEVGRGLEVVEHACAIASLQLGEYAENAASGIDVYTLIQPLGVCAGITAFNFPVMLPCFMFPSPWPAAIPSCSSPRSRILHPRSCWPSLRCRPACRPGAECGHGGADTAAALCEHRDIKAVSFIGSTRVGTEIYRRASDAGKRCQAMMGAKNHCVILPDADPEVALNQLLGATFGAAGQRCMATSVAVFVRASRDWLPEFVARARQLKVNAGTDRPGSRRSASTRPVPRSRSSRPTRACRSSAPSRVRTTRPGATVPVRGGATAVVPADAVTASGSGLDLATSRSPTPSSSAPGGQGARSARRAGEHAHRAVHDRPPARLHGRARGERAGAEHGSRQGVRTCRAAD